MSTAPLITLINKVNLFHPCMQTGDKSFIKKQNYPLRKSDISFSMFNNLDKFFLKKPRELLSSVDSRSIS